MHLETVYHVGATRGQLGKYAFLCGDPDRVALIATHLDSPEHLTDKRGFVVWTGYLHGERVSSVSTGVGGPSAAIVLEELISLGVHTFIRVGTSGSLQEDVHLGDLVIASAAIRDEGTSRSYVPIEFPAVANMDVLAALLASCQTLNIPYHFGVIHSKDAFHSEIPSLTADPSGTVARWNIWRAAGALATDMETALIFVLSELRRCRAGSVMTVVGTTYDEKVIHPLSGTEIPRLIRVGIEAMQHLIVQDGNTAT